MTDATKATILLASLVLGLVGCMVFATYQSRARTAAERQAVLFEGEANAARKAEAQAKADRTAADQRAAASQIRVAQLEADLASHPLPPSAQPVAPDASAAVVVAGLQGLGLTPRLLADGLALSTPDGRITLGWGRESVRVPLLAGRITALEGLTEAQAQHAEAQRQQLAAADLTIAAADTRAEAQQRRAEALQRAVDLTPRIRHWSVGPLYGLDITGQRHLGAYASGNWGPAEIQILYLNRTAAIGAGIRF